MRKLIHIFRKDAQILRVFESPNKLRGEVYDDKSGKLISAFDFHNCDIDKIKWFFDFTDNCYEIPFGRKNGKIILWPSIDVNRRIIWTNTDYDDWKKSLIADGEEEESLTYERYCDDCNFYFDEELTNLDIEVDGYIIAFARIGTWQGVKQGGGLVGTNVKDILSSNCDYCTWYCDRFNVRFEGSHHDGNNSYLYRVANSKEKAKRLVDKIAYHDMSEEEFRKVTKSLRPYVANVYGW